MYATVNKYWPPKPRKKINAPVPEEEIQEQEEEENFEEAEEEEAEDDPECEEDNALAEHGDDDDLQGSELVPEELMIGMGLDPRSPDPPASAYVPATSDAYMSAKPPSPKTDASATASRAERLAMLALLDLT